MAEKRRVRAVVSGRVQGVGFRFFTRKSADAFGVRGFVRNLPNGDVETEAEGLSEAVESFLTAIGKGPSASRVDGVTVVDLPLLGREVTFEVRMF